MAKIVKKGDFMKKKWPKMHKKLVFAPGPQRAQVKNTFNQLQMMLATFYKKISYLKQSLKGKQNSEQGISHYKEIVEKKNVNTLIMTHYMTLMIMNNCLDLYVMSHCISSRIYSVLWPHVLLQLCPETKILRLRNSNFLKWI